MIPRQDFEPGSGRPTDATPETPLSPPPGLLERAQSRIMEFVGQFGTDFGRVLRATSQENPVNGHSRRDFLKQGLAASTLMAVAPSVAMAGQDAEPELSAEDVGLVVADFAENPEHYAKDPIWVDIFLSLNFFDVVYALARKDDSQILGKTVGKASFANLLLQGVTKLTGLNSRVWDGSLSEFVKDYDHAFPHTNVMVAAGLNIWRMGYSEEAKAEVIHGLKESTIGVGLLLFLTSLGKGIQTSEEQFMATIREGDKFLAKSSEETLTGNPVQNMHTLVGTVVDVIGAAPVAAALSQIPLTAFGNAQVARDKLLTTMELSYAIFNQILQIPVEARAVEIEKLDNPVIKKIVTQYAAQKGSWDFNEQDVTTMAESYMEGIGVGMLSGMMDTTQAAFGDAGPSIVGAYQSFGLGEMAKTAFSNVLYTYVTGLVETATLAMRIGVPVNEMLNRENLQKARTFANRSLQNFTAYLRGIEGSPDGAQFGVGAQLGSHLGDIVRMVVQSLDHAAVVVPKEILASFTDKDGPPPSDKILTTKVMNILEGLFDQRNEEMVHMGEAQTRDHNGNPISVVEAERRANWVISGLMSRENARNGAKPHDKVEEEMSYQGELGARVNEVLNHLESIKDDKTLHLDQKRIDLMNKIHEFHRLLEEAKFENEKTGEYMKGLTHDLMHLLEKNPSMLDLFRIEYWEHHLGPELAETAFVVFVQGIHIVGLTPAMSAITYENSEEIGGFWDENIAPMVAAVVGDKAEGHIKRDTALFGSMTMHAGLSSVADNWADEIIHSKQLPKELFFPELAEEYGLDLEEMHLNYTQNATGQYMQFTLAAEEGLKRAMRSEELEGFYAKVYDRFLITKFLAIDSAVLGGGESLIGNSPHFSAIVKELKEIITLGGSFKDVYKHFGKHAARFGLTFAFARYIGPMIEGEVFGRLSGNPFHPDHRGAYEAPAEGHH